MHQTTQFPHCLVQDKKQKVLAGRQATKAHNQQVRYRQYITHLMQTINMCPLRPCACSHVATGQIPAFSCYNTLGRGCFSILGQLHSTASRTPVAQSGQSVLSSSLILCGVAGAVSAAEGCD